MRGGAYVIRTQKPHAIVGLPIIGRHFAYGGETNSHAHRIEQHLVGGGKYRVEPKPWADLRPKVYLIPLPNARWLRLLVEQIIIWVLCPVYNVKGQPPYNLRKVSPRRAKAQRENRDRFGQTARITSAVLRWAFWYVLAGAVYAGWQVAQ